MNLPFEDNEMDAAYAIEATCHAPDKVWFPHFSAVVCLSALWLVGWSVGRSVGRSVISGGPIGACAVIPGLW